MKKAPVNPYGNLKPAPMPAKEEKCDVVAGPTCTFKALDPDENTPKALLKRPGNMRLGTRMG